MTTIPRPPGPRDRAFGLRLLADMQRDYLGFWREAQRRFGDTVYMRQGWFHHYAFMHPDQVREALVDKARSFVRYEQHIGQGVPEAKMQVPLRPAGGLRLLLTARVPGPAQAAPAPSPAGLHACPFHG